MNYITYIIPLLIMLLTVFTSCEDKEEKDISSSLLKQIKVESISLNSSNLTLMVGESYNLTATVLPQNATKKSVIWSSSSSIVSVSEIGLVTANAVGTAKVTATANDGSGIKAICTVSVNSISSLNPITKEDYETDNNWN